MNADELFRSVCSRVHNACENQPGLKNADQQIYQLELLRAKLAQVTIEARAAGGTFSDLRNCLYQVIR